MIPRHCLQTPTACTESYSTPGAFLRALRMHAYRVDPLFSKLGLLVNVPENRGCMTSTIEHFRAVDTRAFRKDQEHVIASAAL